MNNEALLKELLAKWMNGFKRAEARHTSAVEFLLNNEVRLVRMLTTDSYNSAQDELILLRGEWRDQEAKEQDNA